MQCDQGYRMKISKKMSPNVSLTDKTLADSYAQINAIIATTDLWLTCDHFVGKASAMGQPTRPTQPPTISGTGNE